MGKEYSFTDLVLLVGTNPLPNYVVAKYFASNSSELKRIWFLYSEKKGSNPGTKDYAENIEYVLNQPNNDKLVNRKDESIDILLRSIEDISRAHKIKDNISQIIKNDIPRIGNVHLNYTGGTKAMSVHVYQTFKEELGYGKFSASYLDARDYKIKFDDGANYDTKDLRKIVEIEWEHLFRLHGYIRSHGCKEEETKKEFLDLVTLEEKNLILQRLEEVVSAERHRDIKGFYDEANKGKLLAKSGKDPLDYKKEIDKELAQYTRNTHKELFNFLSVAPAGVRFVDEQGDWVYDNFPISGKKQDKNAGEYRGFLNGKWLERYVAWIIESRLSDTLGKDVAINYKCIKKGKQDIKTFEIDVLVKHGYQLCGISCGTSGKEASIKNKGFEIILRTRQLGGDEARAILVTLLEKKDDNGKRVVEKMKNDLKTSTGASPKNFTILGVDDLHPDKIVREIKKMYWGN